MLLVACAGRPFRFAGIPPVEHAGDIEPIPLPQATNYVRLEYYYRVLVRRPVSRLFRYTPPRPSRDVNSLDQLPTSSWYTPRLGQRKISPEELLKGPQVMGPPELPIRVVRAKHRGSNPGFVIADNRDQLYLVKFDPPDFHGIQTTTALIVNRLFWGFGYNVPEDYLFFLRENECPVDPTADISEEEVQLVFSTVARPVNGYHRTTVSRLIDGIYLGPIPGTGVRKDDPNDRIPHEERRVLRALRVFGAFTNQTDIRIDNSLDVYIGEPDEGYIRHYLLDFGEAFGGHGAEHNRPWDGHRHIFSFGEMLGNLATLGLHHKQWESLGFTGWPSVGAFEAEVFDPERWRETYPYAPIQASQPDDNYWAAKIVASLEPAHLRTLVDAALYPEPGAAQYILETLLRRKEKVVRYFFAQVSPLEYVTLAEDWLHLEDLSLRYAYCNGSTLYNVQFLDGRGGSLAPSMEIPADGPRLEIAMPDQLSGAIDYLQLRLLAITGVEPAPRPAEFHFRRGNWGKWVLAGVVH